MKVKRVNRLKGLLRAIDEDRVKEYWDYKDYKKGKMTKEEYLKIKYEEKCRKG